MNKGEFVEIYGVLKRLSTLKRDCFTTYHTSWTVLYKGIPITIEYDRYNNHWIYSSDEIAYCGRFHGSLNDLKNKIRYDIKYKTF